MKGFGDLGQIMRLQRDLKNVQKKLKKMETDGESKDGQIRAVVNGEHELIELTIDQEFLNSADKKKLEKSIISAVNTALEINKELAEQEMSKITGGLNLPGMEDMLK